MDMRIIVNPRAKLSVKSGAAIAMGEGLEIGRRVKELREARGWTLGQLAVYSKVSTAYISRLEGGLVPRPSAMMLNRLAGALGVGLTYLLTGERPPEERPLPDFHMYVSRKFAQTPRFRRALVQAYEALQMIKEEEERRIREREKDHQAKENEEG